MAAKPQLWPPPPVLVCVLFPSIRAVYKRIRERITHALVAPPRQQQQQQRRAVPPPPPPPPPPPQAQQQGQQQQENGDAEPLGWRIRQFFDLEMRAHIRVGGGGAANNNNNNNNGNDNHHHDDAAPPPQPAQPPREQAAAAAAAPPVNDDDFARTIRLTSASFGRLIGGALAMPTIARMMGAALLRLSHVLPLVRVIIAPQPHATAITTTPPAAAVGLLGLWNNLQRSRLFGGDGWKQQQQQQQRQIGMANMNATWSGKVLSGLFLTTSQEWAMSDPVWYVTAVSTARVRCSLNFF